MALGRPQIPKVRVQCFVCGKEMERYPDQVRRNKTGRFLCSEHRYAIAHKPKTVKPRACEWCGKEFVSYGKQPGSGRFCSQEHFNEWRRSKRIKRICEWCGREFDRPPSWETRQAARFCCREHEAASRIKRPLEREHNGKPAVLDHMGYVRIYEPEHPRATKAGWVFEHRHLMEKELGRYLDRDEHVHHINGKKDDNRLENLVVLSHSEHSRHEGNGRWGALRTMQDELAEYRKRFGSLS